jgi:serine/threonine protein kinase
MVCTELTACADTKRIIAGKASFVSCSPLYAPPEAINAYEAKEQISIEPSLDIWAIGVIVYECLARCRAFHAHSALEKVFECAQGLEPYPWERPLHDLPEGWLNSRSRTFFGTCLLRDAAARPTAAQLLKSLNKLNNTTFQPRARLS